MKKILVPCDFSKSAEQAFKFAVKIAQESKGEIIVLFVIDTTFLNGNPTLSQTWAFNLNFLTDAEKEALEKFEAMRRKHSPIHLPVKLIRRIGTLLPEIHHVIVEETVDLVVMGTQANEQSVWRSNTEKALRHVSVPLIALRTDPKSNIKNIVVPVSPEQPNKQFIQELSKLQTFFQATLHLLWINTPEIFKDDRASDEALHKYASEASLTNYTVNVRSDYSVTSGIQHFANEIDADMIAMGTHGWSAIIRFFTGSITRDIVHGINQPVWTMALTQE